MAENHSQKIWRGEYQGAQGALKETNRRYREWKRLRRSKQQKVPTGISFASDFYSAARNHFALAKKALHEKAWLDAALLGVSGVNYLLTAHNIIAQLGDERRYMPMDEWNADQLDVAASIMYRCFRQRFARKLADLGIAAYQQEPERYKLHTLALLKLHLLRMPRKGENFHWHLADVERFAPRVAKYAPQQAPRIYRALGEYYKEWAMGDWPDSIRRKCGDRKARRYFAIAEGLARESGATDQLIKMGVKP